MAPYAALAFMSLLWGSSFLLIKIASALFDPIGYALARVAIAAAALIVVALVNGGLWPGRGAIWGKLAALSFLGHVVPFVLLGKAAELATSADMALMMGAVPIIVFLVGRVLSGGDRWSASAALGLAIGFAGVALALWAPAAGSPASASAFASNPAAGRALALAAAACYALSSLVSAQATREIGAVRAVACSMSISTLTLAVAWLAVGAHPSWEAVRAAPLGPVAAVVALGLFNTALAYVVYFRLIASAGPTFASLNNYIVPLIGIIGGATALGEPVALSAWSGLAMVLCGVVLTGGAMRARPAPAENPT